mgnify:CR=1 FL=1
MLGLAYTLHSEGLSDKGFLEKYINNPSPNIETSESQDVDGNSIDYESIC